MNNAFTIAIITVLGSGVFAGIATFCMNFWKAELDSARARIEELYAAVHRYTLDAEVMITNVRTGGTSSEEIPKRSVANSDRINLLIDLYFPRLHPTFKAYTSAIENCLVADGRFRRGERNFSEDLLRVGNIAVKLKGEVVALSRRYSLRALIDAVDDYDQHRS